MTRHIQAEKSLILNGENKSLRYIFAGIMFLLLILIWPLSLFQTTDSNINNRLLKEDDAYTYYYISSGEYITTVLYGDGSYIENSAVRLRFQYEVPQDAVMHYYMYDSMGNLVVDQHISLFPRPDNDVYEIPFGITMNDNEAYQFLLAPDTDFTVGVYCLGESTEPAVVMHSSDSIMSKVPAKVSGVLKLCIWVCGLLFIGILLFADKVKAGVKNTRSLDDTILLPAIMSFAFLLIYGQYLFDHTIESEDSLIKGAVFIVILTVMAFLWSFAAGHELVIAGLLLLSVGSIYVLAIPEGNIPDEINHFYRAFSLAFGNLQSVKFSDTSVGAVLPTAIQSINNPEAVFDFADTTQIDFNNTSLYAPVCYIPQIIGIRIALLFTGNVHAVFMTARWSGFIGALILYMVALYIIPVGREFMFAIMMLPMTLQEMTGVTSDGMTNALAFLFIAFVLNRATTSKNLVTKDIVIITVLGTLVSMCKIVYVVLLLLLLLLKVDKSKRAGLFYAITFGIPIVICIFSNVFFGQNLVSNGENMEAGEQIKYVLTHIPATIMTVIRSTVEYGMQWIGEMTGDYMGLLAIRTLPVVSLVLVLVLIVSAKNMRLPEALRSVKAIWVYGLTCLFGFLLILGSIYVTWNTVGDFLIRGIQGRYFIAVLPVFGLFLSALTSKKSTESKIIVPESYILLLMNMIVIVDVCTYFIMNG